MQKAYSTHALLILYQYHPYFHRRTDVVSSRFSYLESWQRQIRKSYQRRKKFLQGRIKEGMETEGAYASVCMFTRMSICIAYMVQVKRGSKRFCDNAAKMLSVDPEALVGIWVG